MGLFIDCYFFLFFVVLEVPLFQRDQRKTKKEVTSANSAPCGEMPNRTGSIILAKN